MNVQNLRGVDIMRNYDEYEEHEDQEQIEYIKQWLQQNDTEKKSEQIKNTLAKIFVIIVLVIIFWQFFFL